MKYIKIFFVCVALCNTGIVNAQQHYPPNTLDETFFKISNKKVGGYFVGMTLQQALAETKKRRLTALIHNVNNEFTDFILPSVSIYDGFDCTSELLLQLTILGNDQKVSYIDVRSGRFTTPAMNRPGMSIAEFIKHNNLKNPILNGTELMPWIGETIDVPGAYFTYYFRHFDDRIDTLLKDEFEHDMPNNFVMAGYLAFIRLE